MTVFYMDEQDGQDERLKVREFLKMKGSPLGGTE